MQQVGNRFFVRNDVALRKYDTKFNLNGFGWYNSYRIASRRELENTIILGRNVLRICGVKLKRRKSIIREGSAAVLG